MIFSCLSTNSWNLTWPRIYIWNFLSSPIYFVYITHVCVNLALVGIFAILIPSCIGSWVCKPCIDDVVKLHLNRYEEIIGDLGSIFALIEYMCK